MKVFLIGGAGFIGSYVSRLLLADGHEPIIFDSFLNYVDPFTNNYQNVLNMRFDGIKDKVKMIRGDIRYKGHLLKSLRQNKPEIVVHLAALPIATKSNEFPEDASAINLMGTANVLESMRELKDIERIIFTSSSFTYGNFQYEPADEKHPSNPIDIYGGTKLCGEVLTKVYAESFGVDYTIIRPSAVYGPGDVNKRVVQAFIEKALRGEALTLFEGGEGKIDFTYVSDAAKGFVLAINSKKAKNETFNITAGKAREIKELVGIIKQNIGNVEVEMKPSDTKRPTRGSLDISKAKKLLGFNPTIQLEEGIKKYLQGIKEDRVIL